MPDSVATALGGILRELLRYPGMQVLERRRFTSQAEARMAVFSYIEGWYNPARRHSGIRYLSPIAYETQMLKETQMT